MLGPADCTASARPSALGARVLGPASCTASAGKPLVALGSEPPPKAWDGSPATADKPALALGSKPPPLAWSGGFTSESNRIAENAPGAVQPSEGLAPVLAEMPPRSPSGAPGGAASMPVSPLLAPGLSVVGCMKALLGLLVKSGNTSLLPPSPGKMSGRQVPQASPGRHWHEGMMMQSSVFGATFVPFVAPLRCTCSFALAAAIAAKSSAPGALGVSVEKSEPLKSPGAQIGHTDWFRQPQDLACLGPSPEPSKAKAVPGA